MNIYVHQFPAFLAPHSPEPHSPAMPSPPLPKTHSFNKDCQLSVSSTDELLLLFRTTSDDQLTKIKQLIRLIKKFDTFDN